jgi:hypothetical protein
MVNEALLELVLPVKATEAGWKLQEAFCGRPLHESCTVPV